MAFNTKWFKGLTKEQQAEMKEQLVASKNVMSRLSLLLSNELEESYKSMAKESNFTLPAWSEHQAYLLGEQEALRKFIKMIEE